MIVDIVAGFLCLTFGLAILWGICAIVYVVWSVIFDFVSDVIFEIRNPGWRKKFSSRMIYESVSEAMKILDEIEADRKKKGEAE